MKFSATVTLQYDTVFSSFSAEDYLKGLDWMKQSRLDGAELCISSYTDLDLGKVKANWMRGDWAVPRFPRAGEGAGRALPHRCARRCHGQDAGTLQKAHRCGEAPGQQGDHRSDARSGGLDTAERDLDELSEAMKPLVEYAGKNGVTLCLEAINRYETALLNSAEATVDFIENRLGNPDCVGILWDLFHANIEDIGFERSIEKMGNKLKHVHIADSDRMFPGYGHTDFAGVLKALRKTVFPVLFF